VHWEVEMAIKEEISEGPVKPTDLTDGTFRAVGILVVY
jgi:hypothetical protein